jgi:hypothetical protein
MGITQRSDRRIGAEFTPPGAQAYRPVIALPGSLRTARPSLTALLAPIALILGAFLGAPAHVAASCAGPVAPQAAVQAAPLVFVGTVTSIDAHHAATLHVEEIWKGTNLADPTTLLSGSPEDPRSWEVGTRYLVFPYTDADGNLLDNACTATSAYEPAFDSLRPANAHAPQGPPTSGIPGDPPLAWFFLVVLALGSIGGFFLYRTRRTPAGIG